MEWHPLDWLASLFGYKRIEREASVAENLAREKPSGIISLINDVEFEIFPDRVIQRGGELREEANIFWGGDYHGYHNNARAHAQIAKEFGVDFIVLNGDYIHGNPARGLGGNSGSYTSKLRKKFDARMESDEELVAVVEPFAMTGIPVGVNSGNQEDKEEFNRGLAFLCRKYENVFDFSQIRIFEGRGFNIVSNPYGDDITYEKDRGFYGTFEEIESFVRYVESIQNSYLTILATHQPPICPGEEGIDHTFHSKMQGSNAILYALKMLRESGRDISVVAAHFHEKPKTAVDFLFNRIKEGEYVSNFIYTPGAGSPWEERETLEPYYGLAGITTVNVPRKLIKYQSIISPFPEEKELIVA